ncbi:ROK family protein [Nonomuraea sp. NPDC052265]|uniref:ROK family protein n=1 Tax=Nonomuraea sp. NPDC052265 TaxID=3364374 RepID=UPI0037C68912
MTNPAEHHTTSTPHRPTDGTPVVLGIDIGGTKTAAALIPTSPGTELHLSSHVPTSSKTEVHLPARVRTPAEGGASAVLAAALDLAADRLTQARAAGMKVIACGVGSAGTIDDKGVVTHATDALPGWRGTDLAAAFTDRLGLPVTVLNDVHAWALGEARHGAAKGSRLALVLTIGTGIGGALVRDGELLRGRNGMAGSLGHTPAVLPPGVAADRPCPCGATGHLEAYASGPAILSTYRARGGTATDLRSLPNPPVPGHQPVTQNPSEPTGLPGLPGTTGQRDVTEATDPLAREVIREAALILGRSIASAATLLDPDVIVLGGGVTGLGDLLTVPLIETVRRCAPRGIGSIPVRLSALGLHGAVLGAASAAMP